MPASFLWFVAFLVVGLAVGVVGFSERIPAGVSRRARLVFYLFVVLVVVALFLGILSDASRTG